MHTHTWKEEESVAAEGVTKHARSQPFSTVCHHMVTKHAAVTKCVASASNLTCFVILVTLVTKHVGVTKCGSATPVPLQRKLSVKGDPKQDRSWPEIHKVHKYFHV